jgi:prepilin-type processing-associated H-X9-DG protein
LNNPRITKSVLVEGFPSYVVAFTSYLGIEGTTSTAKDGTLFLDSSISIAHIADGTSNTVLVGERPPSYDLNFGWWYTGYGIGGGGTGDMILGVSELYNGRRYRKLCPQGPYSFSDGRLENPCEMFHFWSLHLRGANFLLADGSVQFLNYSASSVLPALSTRSGSEVVSIPSY